MKANDSKRKSDLAQIQRALEVYYQDNRKYPDAVDYKIKRLDDSTADWGEQWTPYMGNLPKDPRSPSKNYVYNATDSGQTYCIYASLDIGVDITLNTACFPSRASCGTDYKCNYGISSPNITP